VFQYGKLGSETALRTGLEPFSSSGSPFYFWIPLGTIKLFYIALALTDVCDSWHQLLATYTKRLPFHMGERIVMKSVVVLGAKGNLFAIDCRHLHGEPI